MKEKTFATSGADERTPSRSEYFSWINNTNEGSTEAQTKINLDFFRYLREKYGMRLEIYAWDAGNLDGAGGTYESFDSPKLKVQYPNGYKPLADAAAAIDTRLGVWGGADGFGNNTSEAVARHKLIVSLCRDYNFALFKFDTVCGALREDKRQNFIDMICECRKYCPDLIVLNHRNDLGEGEIYATTFLWGGLETYIDVHVANNCTAPHNRAYMFERGHTPELKRLTEDHGVCISSCIDYFEDDLVYQAFNRSLILAPEMYGNPWLMRDDELPILARIYNLHRRFNDILVDAKLLPSSYGCCAVSRGDGKRRFISTGNNEWSAKAIQMKLDSEIGLECCGEKIVLFRRFPTEKVIGVFDYGSTVEIELLPFRATLIEAVCETISDERIEGCEYSVIHEHENGRIDRISVLETSGNISVVKNGVTVHRVNVAPFDIREKSPEKVATLVETTIPDNAEALCEATLFALDNDSLEKRSVDRSGETKIAEVKAARDAFFEQKTYKLRGCDNKNMFDGDSDSFFDSQSRTYAGGSRIDGGCLRVDFGCEIDCDNIEIEYFMANEDNARQCPRPNVNTAATVSTDLSDWKNVSLISNNVKSDYEMEIVVFGVHNIITVSGKKMNAVYQVKDKVRYFRLPEPMDRIFAFRVYKDGELITLVSPRANNLMAAYEKRPTVAAQSAKITLGRIRAGSYIAIGIEGRHGTEGVYCAAEVEGELIGAPLRAPSYPSNVWEHVVASRDSFYTYYIPLTPDMSEKEISLYALFNNEQGKNLPVTAYLCDGHIKREKLLLDI